MTILPHLIIIAFAIFGLILSIHIFRKKREKKPMVCPLHANCEAVIFSQFSTFFGIPLEILGILYYVATGLSYVVFLLWPASMLSTFVFLTLVATTFAFVFSLYLTAIQAFALRNWCTWCLTSAGFCTIIFIATIFSAATPIAVILSQHFQIILTFNMLALSLGVGSITLYSVLFIKFLKDFKISELERDILKTISQITWLSIFLLILTKIGLLPSLEAIVNVDQFLIGIIIMTIIIINEGILNILIAPKMIDISFNSKENTQNKKLQQYRQLSFIITSSSIVSWYSLLALLILPASLFISFYLLTSIYAGLILMAFMVGILLDRLIHLSVKN